MTSTLTRPDSVDLCDPEPAPLHFEHISAQQSARLATVYDLLTPFVRMQMNEDSPEAVLEVLDPRSLGVSALEQQTFCAGLAMMNEAVRAGLLKSVPDTTNTLTTTDMQGVVATLLPGTFDAGFFKAPLIEDIGWQWFPSGFYFDLTPEGSDGLETAIGAGTAALIAFLVELGVPKWLATIVASLLIFDAKELIKLIRAYSDKGTVRVKFLLPFYTPVILPA